MDIHLRVVFGAMMLGIAAGIMLLFRGRILGCSGMVFRCTNMSRASVDIDSILFILGLLLSGFIYNVMYVVPDPLTIFKINHYLLFIGGLFVGAGTYLGNGCTSGHGLCGLSLMRKRSIVAVLLFFPIGILTSWIFH